MKRPSDLRIRRAKHEAARILKSYGVDTPGDIRLKDIAWLCGARVSVGWLSHAAARLTLSGDDARIRIRSGDDPGRIRFSIGHELGHLKLHKDSIQEFKACTERDLDNWNDDAAQELEANTFASELILPAFMVEKRCDVAEVNLHHVARVAEEFRASLTATALKFVEHCPERCAVVMSENGRIRWWKKNEGFPWGLKRGDVLDKRTNTHDCFAGKEVCLEPEDVWASAWLKNDKLDSDAELVEHVVPMPNLGVALTMLWQKS